MKKILTASAYIMLAACTVVSHQAMEENEQYVVDTPYTENQVLTENQTPEAYAIVAARTVNKMLDETSEYYDKSPRPHLYVMPPEKQDENTQDGIYQARLETIDIIEGSNTYVLVNNLNDAEYYLKISAKAITLQNQSPAISYHLTLYSSDNKELRAWTQVIKQVQNDDKSWW